MEIVRPHAEGDENLRLICHQPNPRRPPEQSQDSICEMLSKTGIIKRGVSEIVVIGDISFCAMHPIDILLTLSKCIHFFLQELTVALKTNPPTMQTYQGYIGFVYGRQIKCVFNWFASKKFSITCPVNVRMSDFESDLTNRV